MARATSPLRYPGGKAKLAEFLAGVLCANGLHDGAYVEPYAGGAGAALSLLFGEYVERIVLNDADPCVFAFWKSILDRPKQFIKLVRDTAVTVSEWYRQRQVYCRRSHHSRLRVGFATFFLNRCNRSGIIVNGGPIGGYHQSGEWKLDARFNRDDLVRRIEKIAAYNGRIAVHNLDAIDFLKGIVKKMVDLEKVLVFLDPPYYAKGSQLYLNYYEHKDHARLARFIKNQRAFRWLMTYDDVSEIRILYENRQCIPFNVTYSAYRRRRGRELLICGEGLEVPDAIVPLLPCPRAG